MREGTSTNGIGTLQEKSLHAGLKEWYARPGDRLEVPVDGFLVDIVRGDLLIEIQTGSFSAIKRKLLQLTQTYPVRLVYPIAKEKWILNIHEVGQPPQTRRKSPRRGRLEFLFPELVRFPGLIAHPNFSLEILLTREEEYRINDGQGAWRRKGWSIGDHRLLEVVESISLDSPRDFASLLPPGLPQPFTTRELAQTAGLPQYLAGKMAYCLREMGVIQWVGKKNKAYLYRRSDSI